MSTFAPPLRLSTCYIWALCIGPRIYLYPTPLRGTGYNGFMQMFVIGWNIHDRPTKKNRSTQNNFLSRSSDVRPSVCVCGFFLVNTLQGAIINWLTRNLAQRYSLWQGRTDLLLGLIGPCSHVPPIRRSSKLWLFWRYTLYYSSQVEKIWYIFYSIRAKQFMEETFSVSPKFDIAPL